MSVAGKAPLVRRSLLGWMLAAGGMAIAALAALEAPRLFHSHYPPTPYDDLLALLPDRDSAAIIGKAALAHDNAFNADHTAAALRGTLTPHPLPEAVDADIAAPRLTEVHGWLLPSTLASLCALAAKA